MERRIRFAISDCTRSTRAARRRAGGGGGRGGRGGGGAADGIDLSQPMYFATYGEWTKKEGLAKVDPSKPGAQRLVWDDAKFTFQKAKDADVYVYTKQTAIDYPNYYVASAGLDDGASGRSRQHANSPTRIRSRRISRGRAA